MTSNHDDGLVGATDGLAGGSLLGEIDGEEGARLLGLMMLIRCCEEHLMRLPRPGFQLLSSGEEAVAMGVCAALGPGDLLLSSGRSIGPALARGLAPTQVLAEVLGKAAGYCGGKGGRGHLAAPAAGFFGAHAVVAGNLTVAAGVALAARMLRPGQVVACMFGDGACGAGALHESLNFAALWQLPLVFVCDNNQYAISTPAREAVAVPRLADLAGPFRIPSATVDGMDVLGVRRVATEMVGRARAGVGPSFLECVAYRFATHSTASRESRARAEVDRWHACCPIDRFAARLCHAGLLTLEQVDELRAKRDAAAAEAVRAADAAPYPDPVEALADV